MVSSVILCLVTKNKAIATMTLHSAMTINLVCMVRGINLEIQFHTDKSGFQKAMKSADRLIWLDYGVSIDRETIEKLLVPEFLENCKVLVIPCVNPIVDWDMFKKKTLANSQEPVHQRGLTFDVEYILNGNKKTYADFVCSSSDGRIISLDTKHVLKKLRDNNTTYKSLDQLKNLGVKIGVLKSCPVTCHHVYECVGNIIESSGVRVGP